jgi:hypothetical protein
MNVSKTIRVINFLKIKKYFIHVEYSWVKFLKSFAHYILLFIK